ncbi:MAG: recombinase family protein [Bacillaceae bacterium]
MYDDQTDIRDIAIYCRVSTDEQAREGLSLDEQKHRMKSYCTAMGWKQQIRYFIDDGYSAKDIERPQLTELIQAIQLNHISKVIVTKLDRLSRKLLNLLELIDVFSKHQVSFISVSESFDTNTPSGRLTLQVLGAVAEFERERIRERVVDNMFHAANKGKWLTSAPYGYQLIEKELKIDPKTAPIVKRIYHMYLEKNLGFLSIAKQLNEEGIPSPMKKEWWNRSVKLILTNPVYKGTTIWNRRNGTIKSRPVKDIEEWVIQDNTHEAIIEPEVWDQTQEKINKGTIPARAQSSPHLLSGILKCPQCGSGMSVSPSGSKKSPYKAYRCSAYKNKGTCTGKQYRLDDMHALFKKGLNDLLHNLPLDELSLQSSNKQSQPTTADQTKAIYNAKKRYERKVEAYADELITLEDLHKEKERLDTITKALTRVDSNPKDIGELEEEMKGLIESLIEALDTLPAAKVKKLLGELFEKIVPVDGNHLRFVFKQ